MLLLAGVVLVVLGLVWMLSDKLGMGRIPGDIVIKRKNFTFYFPIVSSIVLSVVLTLVLNYWRK